ncbi:copper chaperone PCu(A)C [Streptomyces canus]|uniref:copper chaperone PCu(A)C n=1 Tax=Streptomyces canus TaxID=58343 RepID=UPI00386C5543|nr:copper chaperone PCu(A)C [Streptomyces canus]
MTSRNAPARPRPLTGGVRIHAGAAVAVLLLGSTALAGCSSASSASSASTPATSSSSTGAVAYDEPVLKVSGAFVRQPVTADMAAGYLTVTNTGRQPDKLTAVTSDIAGTVTLHRTTAANQMEQVKAFTIPAGGSLMLRTGGNHLMLMGLKKKPMAGDTVTFHLRFAESDAITVRAPVEPTTYQPAN